MMFKKYITIVCVFFVWACGTQTSQIDISSLSNNSEEKKEDGNIESSARSVKVLLKNLVKNIVQQDGTVILNEETKKLILDSLDSCKVHIYQDFIKLLNDN